MRILEAESDPWMSIYLRHSQVSSNLASLIILSSGSPWDNPNVGKCSRHLTLFFTQQMKPRILDYQFLNKIQLRYLLWCWSASGENKWVTRPCMTNSYFLVILLPFSWYSWLKTQRDYPERIILVILKRCGPVLRFFLSSTFFKKTNNFNSSSALLVLKIGTYIFLLFKGYIDPLRYSKMNKYIFVFKSGHRD